MRRREAGVKVGAPGGGASRRFNAAVTASRPASGRLAAVSDSRRRNSEEAAPALLAAALLAGPAGAQTIQVDPAIQPYKQVPGVSGNLSSIGSDTLNNLMTLWAEKFNRITRT